MAPFVSEEQSQRMELNRLKAIGIKAQRMELNRLKAIGIRNHNAASAAIKTRLFKRIDEIRKIIRDAQLAARQRLSNNALELRTTDFSSLSLSASTRCPNVLAANNNRADCSIISGHVNQQAGSSQSSVENMSWSENDDDESYVHVNGIRNVMVCPSNISLVNSQPDPSIYCSTRVIPITTPMNINKEVQLNLSIAFEWETWIPVFEEVFPDHIKRSRFFLFTMKDPLSENIYHGRNVIDNLPAGQPIAAINPTKYNRDYIGRAHFSCKYCSRTWFSTRAHVSFWMWPEEVRVKLTGQECRSCEEYELPHWDRNEIKSFLLEVGFLLFGFEDPSRELTQEGNDSTSNNNMIVPSSVPVDNQSGDSNYLPIAVIPTAPSLNANKEVELNLSIVHLWEEWNQVFEEIFADYIKLLGTFLFSMKDPSNANIYLGKNVRGDISLGQPIAINQRRINYNANYCHRKHCGRANFSCKHCSHTWFSARAHASFWLWKGEVRVELDGQQCLYCKKEFEFAHWEMDSIAFVLKKDIHRKAGVWFFGVEELQREFPAYDGRRERDNMQPHRRDLCQACKKGSCSLAE